MDDKCITELDASILLGSGQTVRLALGLSAIFRKPLMLKNIRQNRDNPGLKDHHVASARLIAKITNARLEGDFVQSRELMFVPGVITGGFYQEEIGNLGSSVNVILSAMLPALFALKRTAMIINGGLFFPWVHFYYCVLPILHKIGIRCSCAVGHESIGVVINPTRDHSALRLTEKGRYRGVESYMVCSSLASTLGDFCVASSAMPALIIEKGEHTSITRLFKFDETTMGFDGIIGTGKEETSVEEIDHRAQAELNSAATIDTKTAEQVLPFLALSGEFFIRIVEITEHIETAIWLIKEITGRNIFIDKELNSIAVYCKEDRL